MAEWVDFKVLRESLDFMAVAKHYKVELTIKGDQATGLCPLPTHEGNKESPSFSANCTKGIWQCFKCKAKGNVLDFACRMEGLNTDSRADVRKTALLLQSRFNVKSGERKEAPPKEKELPVEPTKLINAPLDFTLKSLDPNHPYFEENSLTSKTIEHFGLGHCGRGLLKDRIAIPLHDLDGHLVGYAGQAIDELDVSPENPKYIFPGERTHKGTVYEFQKELLLYNAHQVKNSADLIVAQSFLDVWWLWQEGIHNAVALLGSGLSDKQATIIKTIVPYNGIVRILTDGDKGGEKTAHEIFEKISHWRLVRWISIPQDNRLSDFTGKELPELLVL